MLNRRIEQSDISTSLLTAVSGKAAPLHPRPLAILTVDLDAEEHLQIVAGPADNHGLPLFQFWIAGRGGLVGGRGGIAVPEAEGAAVCAALLAAVRAAP